MNKIVVMGGSFNPVTKAHMRLLNDAKKLVEATSSIIVPTGDSYNKADLIGYTDRSNMLKQVIDENTTVSDFEQLTIPHPKSIDTLSHISSMYPTSSLYFIMGLDNFKYFKNWYHPHDILKHYNLIIINRETTNDLEECLKDPFYQPYLNKIYTLNTTDYFDISSSEVRSLIKQKKYEETSYFIEPITLNYIRTNKLYSI